jgi:hypothetical protein
MPRIEYSTMCLSPVNYLEKIREASAFVKKEGFEFGIQLHNSISKELYDLLLPLSNDYHFSIHSPLFSQYFINLASKDYALTRESCDKCIQYLPCFGTGIFFFHGFFMTEQPIIQDMKNYRRTIRSSIGENYGLNKSFIMDPAFFDTDLFLQYKNTFITNFKQLKEDYKNSDLTIALENDFVGIGSGLQRPAEIHELIDTLWFDLGHFWTSSLLHKFDFHEEAYRLIDTKKIVGVHLNHNLITRGSPCEKIQDSHTHFCMPSEMNLAPIVRKLFEKDVGIITLEIVDGDLEDIKTLLEWVN